MKNNMPLTKTDLQQELKKQHKAIVSEISEFLEEHVLEPIFGLKKDVSGLKKDVSVIKKDVSKLKKDMKYVMHEISNINRKIDASFTRGDRHTDQLESHEKRITKLENIPPATL